MTQPVGYGAPAPLTGTISGTVPGTLLGSAATVQPLLGSQFVAPMGQTPTLMASTQMMPMTQSVQMMPTQTYVPQPIDISTAVDAPRVEGVFEPLGRGQDEYIIGNVATRPVAQGETTVVQEVQQVVQ